MDERSTSIREMLPTARASLLGRGRHKPPGHADVRDPHIRHTAAYTRPSEPSTSRLAVFVATCRGTGASCSSISIV